MELWTVYNKDRLDTGRTMIRGGDFAPDSFHLVVHICLFNSKGELLIQQRQPFKKGWSNLWDITVGGSATAGETSSLAAERELFEEIGYKTDLSSIRPSFTLNFEVGFDDYYLIHDDIDLDTLSLQYEEVQDVRWATFNEIIEMIDQGKFINYHKSLIRMIFDMRDCRGAYSK